MTVGGVAAAESGGFLEFDFGGVAEGIEDAEEEIGGDVFGVAVHDGGDAGARGTREAAEGAEPFAGRAGIGRGSAAVPAHS